MVNEAEKGGEGGGGLIVTGMHMRIENLTKNIT